MLNGKFIELLRHWGRRLLGNRVIFDVGAWMYASMTTNPIWMANSTRLLDGISAPADSLTVLDLGAGPGNSALAMGQQRPAAHFIGFDLAPQMVELARRNRAAAGWSPERLALVQGNALTLPFATATVDVVTGHSFLYLTPDAGKVLGEAYRVLAAGGWGAFLEPHAGPVDWDWLWRQPSVGLQISLTLWRFYSWLHRRFSPAQLTATFAAAGFQEIKTEVTLGGFGIFGRGRKPGVMSDK
jgi:ubiquinone/menaquinone biosynthesis C-methylase UbiE